MIYCFDNFVGKFQKQYISPCEDLQFQLIESTFRDSNKRLLLCIQKYLLWTSYTPLVLSEWGGIDRCYKKY